MLIKICGIRDVESALAAAESGADMVGFVFAESRRRVTVEKAKAIVGTLPKHVAPVGVFVNTSPEHVAEVAAFCGLNFAQLSGDESVEACRAVGVPVVKAVRPRSADDVEALSEYADACEYLLIDSHSPGAYGGTGTVGDWRLAEAVARIHRIILAGGLSADNVADAIDAVQPAGVDVSSGVEVDGRKSRDRIAGFVEAVRRAHN